MEVKSYSLGNIARIFLGNRQEFIHLSFNDHAILLSSDHSQVNYPYQNIVGNIELKDGQIWSELSWKLSNDTLIKFDWIILEDLLFPTLV